LSGLGEDVGASEFFNSSFDDDDEFMDNGAFAEYNFVGFVVFDFDVLKK
jgi:hypothetical protein